ncbi:hypothetical protein BKA62DRAFT_430364 [Auriculariales sp. MPI-PUGE-AT-0066]|nr:hypothetical protein BKA62DRAFT_430364 [Auriculariales sp. MPI-PUGE-AT-0066]
MLVVHDIRQASSSTPDWDLSQFTELLQSVRKRVCASPQSRRPFLPAIGLGGASSASDESARDASVLAFFQNSFPMHWTLSRMDGHGLSTCSTSVAGGRQNLGLSGELVDAWVHSQALPDSPHAIELRLNLEFLLTTAILHALYHALAASNSTTGSHCTVLALTDSMREPIGLNSKDTSQGCNGCNVWGGPIGATWRRSALLQRQAEGFSLLEGVYVELLRPSDGRSVEIRLEADLLETALRSPEFAPFDAAKLVTAEGNARRTSAVAVRRRQICSVQDVLQEPPASPWEQLDTEVSTPLTPPTPFRGEHEEDIDDNEDKDFVILG